MLTDQTQSEKFKQAAREHGCDEDEAHWDEALKKVVTLKPKVDPKPE